MKLFTNTPEPSVSIPVLLTDIDIMVYNVPIRIFFCSTTATYAYTLPGENTSLLGTACGSRFSIGRVSEANKYLSIISLKMLGYVICIPGNTIFTAFLALIEHNTQLLLFR